MNNCVDHLFLSKGQPTSARKNILFDHVVCTRLEISLDYIRTESYLQARKRTRKKNAGCQSSIRSLSLILDMQGS